MKYITKPRTGMALMGIAAGLCCPNLADAAHITGNVYDEIHDQYINGCEIKVVETGQVIYTGRGGSFQIYDLKPGSYTLEARAIGLPVTTETIVVGSEDSDLTMDIILSDQEIYELAPITVVSSLMGRAKALNIQKSKDNLVDVVSADAIGQFVDRNAAEALQRQPGITVVDSQGEGKYIVVRGAGPSWNQVMIDGVNVATPDENGRSTALDIISTDQLESIEVTKTWTPDKPAGSVGGTVNLVTRSALDRNERFASVESAIGRYDYAGRTSWRYNAVYGDVIPLGHKDRKLGIQVSVNKSIDYRGSESLSAKNWTANTTPNLQGDTPAGFSLTGLDYDEYAIKRERLAVGGKVEFQLNDRNRFYVSASYNRYNDVQTLQALELNATTNSSVSYRGTLLFTETIATELGYDLDDADVQARLALSSTNSGRKLTYDEAEQLGDVSFNENTKNYDLYKAAGDAQKRFQQVTTEDRIETYQFGGEHKLLEGLTLDYKLYSSEAKKEWTKNGLYLDTPEYSFIIQLDPDNGYLPTMTVNNDLNQLDDPDSFVLNEDHGQVYKYQYFSTDTRRGFETNLKYSYELWGISLETSIGVSGDFRDKEYRRNYNRYSDIELDGVDELTLSSDYFYGGTDSSFLSASGKSYDFGPLFDVEKTLAFILDTPDEVSLVQTTSDVNYNITDAVLQNYTAEENITAAYLMQKAVVGKWNFLGGVRIEHTHNGFGNNVINTDLNGTFILPGYWSYLDKDQYCEWVHSERSYNSVLPAFNVKRVLWNDWVMRASVSKGIARPEFTDLVPFEIVDIDDAKFGRTIQLPNDDLKPMESVNYDMSFEKFMKGIGLVGANFFYKDLDGAIYESRRSDVAAADDEEVYYYAHKYIASDIEANASTWTVESMQNTGAGKLYGVEMYIDDKLTFLPWEFSGLGFSVNYTLVNSQVELLLEERYKEKVPLFQQAKQSGNVSVYYEKHGFLARLSLVWRSKYLDSVEAGDTTMNLLDTIGVDHNALDVYADDHQRLDLLVRYSFNSHFNLFVEATNLTDEPTRFYRGDASRLDSIEYTGSTWFFGGKLSL